MMVSKNMLKTYFHYSWWKLLLISIVIIIIWTVAINELIQPKENEKLIISTINVELNTELLEIDGLQWIENYPHQDILAVFVESIALNGPEFHEFISTRSLPGTDLIILPSASIAEQTASDLFLPLDEEIITTYFGQNVTYYYEGDILYGIPLTSSEYESIFSTYLYSNKEETYYVFINGYSHNIGELNDQSKPNEEAALAFISWLMNE